MDVLRWLRGLSGPEKIDKDEAKAIARAECERRGLPWGEPVRVYRHYGNWSVWTNADHVGGNIRVIIDGRNGDVRSVSGPIKR